MKKLRKIRTESEIRAEIMAKVVVTDAGCWEYSGPRTKGYGIINFRGENMRVHRLMFCLENGIEIPHLMCICHSCDNPPCCNPAHLWLGSIAANNRDAIAKGRRGRLRSCAP